jgi:endonuclease-3
MEPLYSQDFTPETVLNMGVENFQEKIRTIGLAPTKAKNVLKLSEIIHRVYHNEVPHNREQLEDLPGVGRKTANVILGEIFKEPTLAVDTHVFRVTSRLGLHNEVDAKKAELKLLEIIPKKYLPQGHHWFILHGRYVCKAQNPQCDSCCVNDKCPSRKAYVKKPK